MSKIFKNRSPRAAKEEETQESDDGAFVPKQKLGAPDRKQSVAVGHERAVAKVSSGDGRKTWTRRKRSNEGVKGESSRRSSLDYHERMWWDAQKRPTKEVRTVCSSASN